MTLCGMCLKRQTLACEPHHAFSSLGNCIPLCSSLRHRLIKFLLLEKVSRTSLYQSDHALRTCWNKTHAINTPFVQPGDRPLAGSTHLLTASIPFSPSCYRKIVRLQLQISPQLLTSSLRTRSSSRILSLTAAALHLNLLHRRNPDALPSGLSLQ